MMYKVTVYLNDELINTYLAHDYAEAKFIERSSLVQFNGLCQVFIVRFT